MHRRVGLGNRRRPRTLKQPNNPLSHLRLIPPLILRRLLENPILHTQTGWRSHLQVSTAADDNQHARALPRLRSLPSPPRKAPHFCHPTCGREGMIPIAHNLAAVVHPPRRTKRKQPPLSLANAKVAAAAVTAWKDLMPNGVAV